MRGQVRMGVEGKSSRNELIVICWNGSHFLGNFILGSYLHSKTAVLVKPTVGLSNTNKNSSNKAVSGELACNWQSNSLMLQGVVSAYTC